MEKILKKIPALLASKLSIFIYLFLFFYLVIFAFITKLIPALNSWAPDNNVQLVLGNYTNVLSALGASIAAGNGVAVRSKMDKMQRRHEDMHQELSDKIAELHSKLEHLEALRSAENTAAKNDGTKAEQIVDSDKME